jgi:hypothetical protein
MPSDYFNLILSEIRSAESSGKWDAVGLLFFHVGMFKPPEEEVTLIRSRLSSQVNLTDPFKGVMGCGWEPHKWIEDFVARREDIDLRCLLLGRRFSYNLKDPDYHKVSRLLLVEDVYEGLYTLGAPEPDIKAPKTITDETSDAEAAPFWAKNIQDTCMIFYAMAQLYLMTEDVVEGQTFPRFNLKLKSKKYKDLVSVYKLYGKFLEARKAQDDKTLEAIRCLARDMIEEKS